MTARVCRMDLWNAFKGPVSYWVYCSTGKRPWSRGYGEYRRKQVIRVLNAGDFEAERLPPGYGRRLDERIVEYPWCLTRLPDGPGTLLDAGSVLNHDFLLTRPKLASKRLFISTLAAERASYHERGISYVYEDLRESCFRDAYFDWVVSLSTIEHIGMDNTMLYTADDSKRESDSTAYLGAVREFRRVLRPGGRLYLSVPFGLSKNYGWFQVFDAPMVDRLLEAFSPGEFRETHFRYTPEGWTRSSRVESKDATYFDIHRSKSYDPDYAAASRAVVCLELLK
jgi:SAM-dependent methyltransferase